MSSKKLPPLKDVDKDLIDHGKVEINPPKCKHTLELVSATEVRCKKCSAGWTGPNIHQLLQ